MRKILYSLTIVLAIVAIVGSGCAKSEVPEQDLDTVFTKTAELRYLSPKSEVKYQFVTNEELRDRLVAIFKEDYPQEEAEIDQEVYVLLDLMEEDQDLYSILLDVYSEQVIGMYDDESKELYIVSEEKRLSPLRQMIIAHEYTHALQDQHFDLSSLPLEVEDNSDLSLAVLSLVEGDAAFVQNNYKFYLSETLSQSEFDKLIKELSELESEKFEAAPEVVKVNLLFPYLYGQQFVYRIWSVRGPEAVNQAYSAPPQSTEQILHLEKYLDERDEPQAITMPDLESALGVGWAEMDSDVLGELGMIIYLGTFITAPTTIAAAAEGWDGDRYVYLKNTEGEKLLVLRSTWDSVGDAEEFFNAYITFVEEKSGGAWDLHLEEKGKRQWTTYEQSVYLSQKDSSVLIIIAPDEDATEKVLDQFPIF